MSQNSKNSATAMTETKMDKGVLILHVQAERQDSTALSLHYQVINQADQALYLVNRPFRWTQAGLMVDANVIYTELVDGSLRLTKACIPVPDRMKVEDPTVPYLTHLAPGGSFEENVIIPLPLSPYHPYDRVSRSSDIHEFDSFTFAVGWLQAEKVSVRSQQRPNGMTLLSTDYGPVRQHQEILKVELPVSVPASIKV